MGVQSSDGQLNYIRNWQSHRNVYCGRIKSFLARRKLFIKFYCKYKSHGNGMRRISV